MKSKLVILVSIYIFMILVIIPSAFGDTYDESYASQGVVIYSHETIGIPKGYNTFVINNLPSGAKHVEWYFDGKYMETDNYSILGLDAKYKQHFYCCEHQVKAIVYDGNWKVLTAYVWFVAVMPSAPTGLSVTNITSNSATICWNGAPGASYYTLVYRKDGDTWYSKTHVSSCYTLYGLSPNTKYYFYVSATNSAGSAHSYTESFTTKQAEPKIISAYWQAKDNGSTTFIEGEIAKLTVKVKNIPEGAKVKFDIYEDDTISNDYIETVYANVKKYNDGNYYAVASWKTLWVDDGVGNPEYIFKAHYKNLEKTSNSKIKVLLMPGVILRYLDYKLPKYGNRLMVVLYDPYTETLLANKKLQVTVDGRVYNLTTGEAGSFWKGLKDLLTGYNDYSLPGVAFINNLNLNLPANVTVKIVDKSLPNIKKTILLDYNKVTNLKNIKLKLANLDNKIIDLYDVSYDENKNILSFILENCNC